MREHFTNDTFKQHLLAFDVSQVFDGGDDSVGLILTNAAYCELPVVDIKAAEILSQHNYLIPKHDTLQPHPIINVQEGDKF